MRRLIIDTSGCLAGTAAKHPLSAAVREILDAVTGPPELSHRSTGQAAQDPHRCRQPRYEIVAFIVVAETRQAVQLPCW